MSKELATLTNQELNEVLRNSLFPGASDMALELVKSYCHAAGLDIMMKPCHIVPMWNSKLGRSVDTIMPGIGSYRITAARTGQYAGISEPKYGPVVTNKIGGVECTYPEWCEITVKRNYGEFTAEFTSHELWIENYAEKGGKERSVAPNSMWMKRPFGQIKKCSEAQALRMAFPEVGSQPTADEMEGKETEIIINPMPSDKPNKVDVNAILESIKTMAIADFSSIDKNSLTPDEQTKVSIAFRQRKKQIADSQVVATQHKEPENADIEWYDLMSSVTDQSVMNEISASIPDNEMKGVVESIKDGELLNRLYKSLTKDRRQMHNETFDGRAQVLEG